MDPNQLPPVSISSYSQENMPLSQAADGQLIVSGHVSSDTGTPQRGSFPFRRSYKACLHCRERKVKCDLGSLEHPSEPPCARCKREGRKCEFVPSRRGGAKNVRAGKAKQLSESYMRQGSASMNDDDDDDDDQDDEGQATQSGVENLSEKPKRPRQERQITGSLIKDRGLHTTADALNILAHVADTAEGKDRRERAPESDGNGAPQAKRVKIRDVHARWTFRSTKLSQFAPVQKGMITEEEILILLKFFFETLHPYYPYIPPGLQPPNNLAAHPILLVTILSLASRYCDLPDPSVDPQNPPPSGNSPRSKQVHSAIWTYGESLISQTVWAEASSISLATVLAFLLLSQWNPRAVHYRIGDYANPVNLPSNDEDGRGPEGGGGYGGFAAARRSDRMAWMMIGVAIRLAQDMNLFSKWREICLACFYSDITLALRLGRPSMLSYSFQDTPSLTFSHLDNAKLDILRILSFAHQSLYSSPGSMHKILNSQNYLPLLKYFRSKLLAWNAKYQFLFKDDGLESECLLMEFHYTELYIYSLALSPPGHRQVDESLAELYILFAAQAAQQCICVIRRVHQIGLLKWAPIQWFVRAVHAAIFLAKVLALERDPPQDRQQDLLSVIRGLATVMEEASPDDIHMAGKYATALLHLCNQIENEIQKKHAEHMQALQAAAQQRSFAQPSADGSVSSQAASMDGEAIVALPNIVSESGANVQGGMDEGIFDSAFGGTAIAEIDSMKWFIDSYGIGFDGNYAMDQDWLSPNEQMTGETTTGTSTPSANNFEGVTAVDYGFQRPPQAVAPDEPSSMPMYPANGIMPQSSHSPGSSKNTYAIPYDGQYNGHGAAVPDRQSMQTYYVPPESSGMLQQTRQAQPSTEPQAWQSQRPMDIKTEQRNRISVIHVLTSPPEPPVNGQNGVQQNRIVQNRLAPRVHRDVMEPQAVPRGLPLPMYDEPRPYVPWQPQQPQHEK
ncbi:hypothetical protein POJ06DRAFT_273616 [Lipomyces tetrasporus]|uniref:Zn(2)-C6 fungal-type domain-containing protein n=1 Tax=Lipomyces tetrasporus TaxID=54092 RepID=A0AAD7QWY8_9ASCO|nr:uncharacterized protein POJ06DRAFT_273616 [Lipomyces tetrasporus]KAJ8103025.1 hypothetical protein POJ06DRAFT_273616 [Lipomyces tetrasporus]